MMTVFHQRAGDAPSHWWQNAIKVINFRETNCMLYLNRVGTEEEESMGQEIVRACQNPHKVSLLNLNLSNNKILHSLFRFNSNLSVISLGECTLGSEAYGLLRCILVKSPQLHTVHICCCHAMRVFDSIVDLVCELPAKVVNLIIDNASMNLEDILKIVESNPQLELLGFAQCRADPCGCKSALYKTEILARGGPKLQIVDSKLRGFSNGFFDQIIR
jgi:hypothetical protein